MAWQRPDGRDRNQTRPLRFEPHFAGYAAGSVLTYWGNTIILCTATVQPGVPRFLAETGQGWLTAEYRMLPGATPERQQREFQRLSGRTQEIQRLIGRSLRAALDLSVLGERTLTIDADVLQADGGTRTAAITGGYVALALAIAKLQAEGELAISPLLDPIAAVSVGLIEGEPFLDLNYPEDVAASVDLNVVMTGNLALVEVQGTAESGSYSRSQLNQMIDLAEQGVGTLLKTQQTLLSQYSAVFK